MKRRYYILPFSAETDESLRWLMHGCREFLAAGEISDISDLECSLAPAVSHLPSRSFVVAQDIYNAQQLLDTDGGGSKFYGPARSQGPVFLFPGGGAQHVNMARGLYFSEPFFRAGVDEGITYAREITGIDYINILYPAREDDHSEMTDPEIALPLLFIVEYTLAKFLQYLGLAPGAMIGHSLGEYAAAAVAGVFSYKDAVRIVCLRGKLMKKVEPGLMLSVAAGLEVIDPLLDGTVSVGAINSPGHSMLSGRKPDILRMKETFESKGIQAKLIHISVASHSFMMDPILEEFRATLGQMEIHSPSLRFVSNLYGDWMEGRLPDAEYWTRHLRNTVLFSDGIAKVIHEFPEGVFIEMGPGYTLANLARLHIRHLERTPIVNMLKHPINEADDEYFTRRAIGDLWGNGYSIDWDAYFQGQQRRQTPLSWLPQTRDATMFQPDRQEPSPPPGSRMEKAKDKMALMRTISKNK